MLLDTPITTDDPPITQNKRRKSADQLSDRMLNIYGKKINDYVAENLCLAEDESTELFLAAALKEPQRFSSSTVSSSLDAVTANIFPTDGIQEASYGRVMDDQRVKDAIILYPKRNIIFTSVEKDLV